MKNIKIFTLLLAILLVNSIHAQPVTLDPTFGQNGMTVIPNTSEIRLLEFDKSGNIIAVGYTQEGSECYLTILKTNPDGILDPNFGDNGIVRGLRASATAQLGLKITKENKIFITGGLYVEQYETSVRTYLQYNEDGSIDETFGDNGQIVIVPGFPLYSLNIESDDFILFGGEDNNSYAPLIFKRNYDGTIDETFGKNGFVYLTDHETFNIRPEVIKILSDQSILIAGSNSVRTENPDDTDGDESAFCKISPNGNLVTAFANNGIWSMNIFWDIYTEVFEYFTDIIEDSKGNLILHGTFTQINLGTDSSFICRFYPNGTIDTDFGTDGFYHYFYNYRFPKEHPQKILQNGSKYIIGAYDAVHSVNYNGTLDESFNNTGSFSCKDFPFKATKLQKVGKLILGGSSNGNASIVRLNIPYEVSVKETPYPENLITIYPNPSTGELQISPAGGGLRGWNNYELRIRSVEVFDVYGRKLLTENCQLKTTIDISYLNSGVYFVKIATEQGMLTKKIVKL